MSGDARLLLPPGCYGVQAGEGGKQYNGKPGGVVTIDERDVPKIASSTAGRNGLLTANRTYGIGTRAGRLCTDEHGTGCRFLAQAWSETCPKCGSATQEV